MGSATVARSWARRQALKNAVSAFDTSRNESPSNTATPATRESATISSTSSFAEAQDIAPNDRPAGVVEIAVQQEDYQDDDCEEKDEEKEKEKEEEGWREQEQESDDRSVACCSGDGEMWSYDFVASTPEMASSFEEFARKALCQESVLFLQEVSR